MSAAEQVRAFKVHGRVQGVGFRWWVQRRAQGLGLRGTVRNCHDGTVEIAIAGSIDATDEMRRLLERGPSSARVERLEELPPPGELPEDFLIGY
jgi:acylphosphatase